MKKLLFTLVAFMALAMNVQAQQVFPCTLCAGNGYLYSPVFGSMPCAGCGGRGMIVMPSMPTPPPMPPANYNMPVVPVAPSGGYSGGNGGGGSQKDYHNHRCFKCKETGTYTCPCHSSATLGYHNYHNCSNCGQRHEVGTTHRCGCNDCGGDGVK